MKNRKEEGEEIARLLSDKDGRIVGLVHLWNTAELSILWISNKREAQVIDPPLRSEIIERARTANADEIFKYLETLSKKSQPKTD